MKKSLVLAMALAMGVAASAYAANPFSDVPAGHWAYDSIDKLAAAGVVDGYGDGSYRGDKLLTRYEMAQIIARAMAKGANVDRLAAEFADELDALGVRVAALEKKADNVKITGQIRYEYAGRQGNLAGRNVALNRLRTRLFVGGAINDHWTYGARIENNQNFHNDTGDETTKFNLAYVEGRLGGLNILAGKALIFLGDGNIYDDYAEVIQASYGKDVKLTLYGGKAVDMSYADVYGAAVEGKFGGLGVRIAYDKFKDAQMGVTEKDENDEDVYYDFKGSNTNEYVTAAAPGEDNGIFNVTLKYDFGDFGLGFTYLHSDLSKSDMNSRAQEYDPSTDGYVVNLSYKGANKNKPGTWGLWANYYDQGAGTAIAHTMKTGDWYRYGNEGFKGWAVGGTYTLAKNMVYMLDYYDFEGKESEMVDRVIWSRLQLTF